MTDKYDVDFKYYDVDTVVQPESSWISLVAYDIDNGITYVTAASNGCTYGFVDTTYDNFVRLAYADSVGGEYQSFSDKYGPAINLGEVKIRMRDGLTGEFKEDEVYDQSVESENEPPVEDIYHRMFSLKYAVVYSKNKDLSVDEVLLAATRFSEYLNGE